MNKEELKKVIVEELESLNEYFHESGKEQLEEEQIELFANNILAKIPDELFDKKITIVKNYYGDKDYDTGGQMPI